MTPVEVKCQVSVKKNDHGSLNKRKLISLCSWKESLNLMRGLRENWHENDESKGGQWLDEKCFLCMSWIELPLELKKVLGWKNQMIDESMAKNESWCSWVKERFLLMKESWTWSSNKRSHLQIKLNYVTTWNDWMHGSNIQSAVNWWSQL